MEREAISERHNAYEVRMQCVAHLTEVGAAADMKGSPMCRPDQPKPKEKNPMDDKRAPADTPVQPLIEHRAEAFSAFRTGDPANAGTEQQAQDQQGSISSDILPTLRFNDDGSLEAAGVKFGEIIPEDPLFQFVELPQGWKKVRVSQSDLHLVDDKGRRRAYIFYETAFFGRDAYCITARRYNIRFDHRRQHNQGVSVALVVDGEKVVHTTPPVDLEGLAEHELQRRAIAAAAQWLNEHFPEWKSASAYWD